MMALVHDHLTITRDQIIDFILPNETLDHRHIQHLIWFVLPCPDPPDLFWLDTEEQG